MITEPTPERYIVDTPNSNFLYPFLFSFEKIKYVPFSKVEAQGGLEIYIKDDIFNNYSHFYVTIDYVIDAPKSLIYLENKGLETLVLAGCWGV
ncbi:MAG: hypothetical protein ACUVRG_00815 [Ignavibacterium sp.]|uniref:hypothetical protein n=1 Tax=Ignavibacterium sp. TaxID=2651167 RepID=UPI00404B7B3C